MQYFPRYQLQIRQPKCQTGINRRSLEKEKGPPSRLPAPRPPMWPRWLAQEGPKTFLNNTTKGCGANGVQEAGGTSYLGTPQRALLRWWRIIGSISPMKIEVDFEPIPAGVGLPGCPLSGGGVEALGLKKGVAWKTAARPTARLVARRHMQTRDPLHRKKNTRWDKNIPCGAVKITIQT